MFHAELMTDNWCDRMINIFSSRQSFLLSTTFLRSSFMWKTRNWQVLGSFDLEVKIFCKIFVTSRDGTSKIRSSLFLRIILSKEYCLIISFHFYLIYRTIKIWYFLFVSTLIMFLVFSRCHVDKESRNTPKCRYWRNARESKLAL